MNMMGARNDVGWINQRYTDGIHKTEFTMYVCTLGYNSKTEIVRYYFKQLSGVDNSVNEPFQRSGGGAYNQVPQSNDALGKRGWLSPSSSQSI